MLVFVRNLCFIFVLFLSRQGVTRSTEIPIFVSLGSYCRPAHILKDCNMRHAAYPFDWIMSFDGEGLIQALNEDFKYFLDLDCLIPYGDDACISNTAYNFQLIHEGKFLPSTFAENFARLCQKYQRRIDRFNRLGEYKGKVYFIRESFCDIFDTRFLYSPAEACREISDEFAMRLFDTIQRKFPALNAHLIVINHSDGPMLEVEKIMRERIVFVKTNHAFPMAEFTKEMKLFYEQLLND